MSYGFNRKARIAEEDVLASGISCDFLKEDLTLIYFCLTLLIPAAFVSQDF
jgi:hypothetical protein